MLGDNPVIPLLILLAVLVAVLEVMRPGIVNERWIANTIKFAIPLAMLAACQTMTMLTGGIDMSAGIVATIAAFVMATQVPILGVPRGDRRQPGPGAADRASPTASASPSPTSIR